VRTDHVSTKDGNKQRGVCERMMSVAGVCADLLLSYQRNSVRVVKGGKGGDEGCSGRF